MKTPPDRIRVAVVGIGGRGEWAAMALASHPLYDLAALCDRSEARTAYFKEREGLQAVPAYPSIENCLAAEQLDAVAVTTHDGSHAQVAVPALQAGKHVFLEKPLDITREACEALVRADIEAGGKTFVGHNLRFAPVYAKARELIDEGRIGDVLTIQTDEFYDGGRTYFRRWNRLREFGGGLWITKACHDFDAMHWFAGRSPVSVSAVAALTYYRPREDAALYCDDCAHRDTCPDSYFVIKKNAGIEEKKLLAEVAAEHGAPRPDLCLYNSDKDTFDHGIATVCFEADILGTYTCNVVTGFTDRRIRVSGTKGTIDGSLGGDRLIVRKRDPSSVEEVSPGTVEGGHGGGDSQLFNDFHDFVRGAKEPKVRPAEAMIAVLMGLAATRSADEGRVVPMCEFGLTAYQ